MQVVYIWKRTDTGQLVGSACFSTRELAVASLEFSCHRLEEKPKKIMDSHDEATYHKLEIWDAPVKVGDDIRWDRLVLDTMAVYDSPVQL